MRRLLLALMLVLAAPAWADTGPEKLSDPTQEGRAVALQKQMRCLVCQGESLDESAAPLAGDLRRLIRARIQAGDSDAQVEAYLVARYGDFILMKPPLKPETYALWFGPLGVLLLGGTAVCLVILRARRRMTAENR
jgi:cytochrome c-type biogenesis protein CcmH